jgi:putative glutamine amidotransferase
MKMPVIGITTFNELTVQGYPAAMLLRAYLEAILRAGGIPLLIPSGIPGTSLETVLTRLDGVLFTGGGDISIEHSGGQNHAAISKVDAGRDELELPLMQAVILQGKPFLGICRGFQLLNVVLGGTLYTHIPAQKSNSIKHDYYPDIPRDHLAHKVVVDPDSRLGEILGVPVVEVNSLHHQGVNRVASRLKAVGHAPDGLVESLELPDHPFGLAVQWHPEWLKENVSMRRLFDTFIEACGNTK